MPQYMTLKIDRIDDLVGGVRRINLRDPDGWRLPRIPAGAHIELQIPDVGTRIYSLCGDPAIEDTWQIAIKRSDVSRGGSDWIHDDLKIGDVIYSSFPRVGFTIEERAERHIMIAGGIGITPFLSMAHVFERRGDTWEIHMLHRGPMEITSRYPDWIASGKLKTYDTSGGNRPDLQSIIGKPNPSSAAYCCGPEAMIAAFQQHTANWLAGHAQIEYFLPPTLAEIPVSSAYTVRLAKSGLETSVSADESLLNALKRIGKKVDSSCEGGICGVCEIAWLEGEPVHRDLILSPERKKTHLLACVSGCASERLVIDL